VLAIHVTPGETVRSGDSLLEFGASAAAVSAYQQAISGLTRPASSEITRPSSWDNSSQHATSLPRQTRSSLTRRRRSMRCATGGFGPAALQTLTAPFDGIIATIPVAQGDRVPPGATVMTITRLDGLVVTVGIEPSARARVRPGEAVHLTPLSEGPPLEGHIVRVDGALNPKTRLLDADVSVSPGSVMSGMAYQADITVGEIKGWIVPHDAVLMDAKGAYLFQVVGSTASRVDVKVAGTAGADDVVQGALDSQRPIVVQGNYQLSDNAAVRMTSTLTSSAQ